MHKGQHKTDVFTRYTNRPRMSENMKEIARINEQARAAGMSYGTFVAAQYCKLSPISPIIVNRAPAETYNDIIPQGLPDEELYAPSNNELAGDKTAERLRGRKKHEQTITKTD